MKAALQARYLWLIVSGEEKKPVAPATTKPDVQSLAEWKAEKKELLDWMQRDQAAMGLMKGAVELSQLPHIWDSSSAKAMCDKLKKIHVEN